MKLGRQTFVVGANSDRGRGLQGPQSLRLEPTMAPVSGVVRWWITGIHENWVHGPGPEYKPNIGVMQSRIRTLQRGIQAERENQSRKLRSRIRFAGDGPRLGTVRASGNTRRAARWGPTTVPSSDSEPAPAVPTRR